MTVSLPDQGDGSRRRRREEVKRKTHRRPSVLRVLVVLGATAALGGLVWAGATLLGDDTGDGGRSTATSATSTVAGDEPAADLLVVTDDAGTVIGVTVFQPVTDSIVHVPPGTLVEVASVGLVSLSEAHVDGGVELLAHSLENLLGVRFGDAVELTSTALAGLAPGLTVTVPEAVEERDASGRVVEVLPAGDLVVDATSIGPLLGDAGDGTTLGRIVRHQAFWSAFVAAGPDSPLTALDELDASAQQRVLPVEAVAGTDADDELYRVIEADVADLVQRLFPGAPTERIRVRILNGVGAPGMAQVVQPLLVDVGGRVTLSGNADRLDYETTQVVYDDDSHRADAEAIRDAIGVGEIVKSLNALDVVDVTIVIGADFLSDPSGG